MEIWNIDLSSDECQYGQGPSAPSKPYTCNHPENYTGECVKRLCPVASQSGVEADAESRDDLEEQFSPHEWIPGGIDK